MVAERSEAERLAVLEDQVSGGFQRADLAFAQLNARLDDIDTKLSAGFSEQNTRISVLELEHARQQAFLRALMYFAAIPSALVSITATILGVIIGVRELM